MYHIFLGKHLIDIAARVCMCVCACAWVVCVRPCMCVCMCGRGRSSTSLITLYVNLNEAVATCQNHLRFHLYHF